MRFARRAVASYLENQRPQLLLPFPDEKTIDMRRCCAILHVSRRVVDRLRVTRLCLNSAETCIVAYNTMPYAPLRIDYDSLVRFLDGLRSIHAIEDRRPPLVFGRHRDEHLLPFPWSDTITVEDAAEVLNINPSNVRLRIEAGQFEAYQLAPFSPWRVSRSSLAKVVARFGSAPASVRHYRHSSASNDALL